MAIHGADLLAEQRLLQVSYHQPEFLDKITEDLFSTKSNQNIFNSILWLNNNNIPLTRDALFQQYLTIDIDGNSTTIDLISQPQNSKLSNIDDIIVQLTDFKKRRYASVLLRELLADIDKTPKLNEDFLKGSKEKLTDIEISLSNKVQAKSVLNMEQWFDLYEVELNKRKLGKQYYFNDFIFDTLVPAGPLPGEIGLIVSSSGSGKSTLCLNLINNLINGNIPCMYFSLEMSSITTLDRLSSLRTGIPYPEIVSPKEQNEFEGIIAAIQQEKNTLINNTSFRFSEDASISLAELYQHIKKFQADINQTYCIVVVDLLSMITDFCKSASNMPQLIEVGINALSAMTKELGVHVLGVLQYNRGTEADAGKIRDRQDLNKFRPSRAQIKNSNAWLERARWVLSTFRPAMYASLYLEPDEIVDMIDIIEVSVVKANNSVIGKRAEALFNGETFSIEPIEDDQTLADAANA